MDLPLTGQYLVELPRPDQSHDGVGAFEQTEVLAYKDRQSIPSSPLHVLI